MGQPSRKQLVHVINRQRHALRNLDAVLRDYRREIVRLGGDPSKIQRSRFQENLNPETDELKFEIEAE